MNGPKLSKAEQEVCCLNTLQGKRSSISVPEEPVSMNSKAWGIPHQDPVSHGAVLTTSPSHGYIFLFRLYSWHINSHLYLFTISVKLTLNIFWAFVSEKIYNLHYGSGFWWIACKVYIFILYLAAWHSLATVTMLSSHTRHKAFALQDKLASASVESHTLYYRYDKDVTSPTIEYKHTYSKFIMKALTALIL